MDERNFNLDDNEEEIKQEIEEQMPSDVLDDDWPDWIDAVFAALASDDLEDTADDFFDDLLFGEEEEPDAGTEGEEMSEGFGVMATATAEFALGGVIGVLASATLWPFALNILSNLSRELQQKIKDREGRMDEKNRQFILDAFQKDETLVADLQRFDELTEIVTANKGKRSEELRNQRAELKELGPAITDKLGEIYQGAKPDMPRKGRPSLDYYGRNKLRPQIKR